MNRYEKETQHLFVSSERLFGSGGTQNHFKIELNDAPFKNDDSSILRLSLQQFNMCKNFANVNHTNNKIRMFMKGFTHTETGIGFKDIDTIVTIPVGNYSTHNALAQAFAVAVKEVLENNAATGTTAATITPTGTAHIDKRLTCILNVADIGTDEFNWDQVPRFVCLMYLGMNSSTILTFF